jgi:dTDP-glucose 4,6-dehydratase
MNGLLVTGGAGFIGSNFVHEWFRTKFEPVAVLDLMTYAADKRNVSINPLCNFTEGNIGDKQLVKWLLNQHKPRAIIHFAAESHVDHSVKIPEHFVHNNVLGTVALFEEARCYWEALPKAQQQNFRFIHISTDEVYGSLLDTEAHHTEKSIFAPTSPYSASKAAADNLALAYYHTYKFPIIVARPANNYGPHQHPEKLVPKMMHQMLNGQELTIYGSGLHVRDWLNVHDHCAALRLLLKKGIPGEAYNIAAGSELTTIAAVYELFRALRSVKCDLPCYTLKHVQDRAVNDKRYGMNGGKIRALGWHPQIMLVHGLRNTAKWYLNNRWALEERAECRYTAVA